MALCRCITHKPRGTKRNYVAFVEPIGYPTTSSICGRLNCSVEGLIWLTKEEYNDYQNGQDIFQFASSVTKVKVHRNI